jgi:Flp pilus assembly protein TadG
MIYLDKIFSRLREKCSTYIRQTSGAIAIMFAIMLPILIGSVGMALDFAQAYLVQQRLAQAIDASALAGAASSADPTEIEQKIKDFFAQNYPPEKLGVTFIPEVQVIGSEIIVSGSAYHQTSFLRAIGITQIDVNAETTVVREVQGLEVVMVLDNTGSMATNNNIASLKTATQNFIGILYDNTSDPDFIRIGMVPYSNSVRIGSYGVGLNPDGTVYDADTFVTVPSGVSSTNTHNSTNWYGCVVEHKADGYAAGSTHVANTKGQLWNNGGTFNGHGWSPASGANDPYPDDVLDDYEGPWDIYAFGRVIASGVECDDIGGAYSNSRCSNCTGTGGNCASAYCYCWKSSSNAGINDGCPYAQVVPLTSDEEYLLLQVEDDNAQVARGEPSEPDDMEPHGNTLGNIGMVWGYRLISPEPPFEEAHDWDDFYWRKAIVMMTDGDNTNNGTYSSFWFDNKHGLGVADYNERFEETCDAIKEAGVIIYTVTFTSEINDDTKGYYERCATDETKYFDAPSQEELIDVFETIARELSNLHIKG